MTQTQKTQMSSEQAKPSRQSKKLRLGGVWLLPALSFAVGCYGSAPPPPPEVAVAVVPGETVSVEVHSEDAIEKQEKKSYTCPQGHVPGSPQCLVTTYWEDVPVIHWEAEASYADNKLSLAEFVALTDPNWNENMTKLKDYSASCQGANIPRYVGIALLLTGLVGMGVGAAVDDKDTGKAIVYGGIGAIGVGIGSYTLGYFAFGGNKCAPATQIYNSIPSTKETKVHSKSEADAMKKAAKEFNSRSK